MLSILRLLTTGRRSKNSSGQLFKERTACDKSQFVTEKDKKQKYMYSFIKVKKKKNQKCDQLKKKPAKQGSEKVTIAVIIIIIVKKYCY